MGYIYNSKQLAAIDRMLRGEHDIITQFIAGERADYKGFNFKYDELQGCLSYLKENSSTVAPILVSHLRDVGDVSAPSPAVDDVLVFDGQYWVAKTVELPDPNTIKKKLTELDDVSIGQDLENNNFLAYDAAQQVWKNSTFTTPKLEELNDVVVTNKEPNQILEFDGTNWINVDMPVVLKRFDLLQDVGIQNPTDGQLIKYDSQDARWVNYTLTLDSVSGISINDAQDGQILQYDEATEAWVNVEPNKSLSGLTSDVSIASLPEEGQALIFTSGYWQNKTIPSTIRIVSGLDDVSIQSPTDGQVLKFDSVSEKWINAEQPDTLEELNDVSIATPQSKDVVRFNAQTSLWENEQISFSSLSDVSLQNLSDNQTAIFSGGVWQNIDFSILNLNDVSSTPAPTDKQTLIYNASTGEFASTTLEINSLSDAAVSSPQDGDSLTFNQVQGKWINTQAIRFLYGLNDVNLGTLTDKQFLSYNASESKWKNQTLNIENINNVEITAPALKNILSYDGAKWANTFVDMSYFSDFDVSNLSQNQILYYDEIDEKWKNKDNSLQDLVDTNINTAGLNEALLYDSATNQWVNKPLRIDTHFSDANITAPTANQSLVFNGFKWSNIELNNALSGLSDVSFETAPENNQTIIFDAVLNKWVNSGIQLSLVELSDASIVSAEDAQVLTYDADSGSWVNADSLISGLKDVQVDNLLDGQFLSYNAATDKWVNITQQSIISNLSGLNDVVITSLQNEQALQYDSALGKWVNVTPQPEVTALTQLTDDVEIVIPDEKDVLTYDSQSSKWVNSPLTVSHISDINITTLLGGQTIVYDEASQEWVNGTPSISLEDLDNVLITAPAANQSLIYDGQNWVNGVADSSSTTQTTYQMNVLGAATRIDDSNNLQDRIYAVQNIGEFEIYIGFSSAVSSSNGYVLYPGDTIRVTLTSSGTIYGIAGFGLGRVSVIRGR